MSKTAKRMAIGTMAAAAVGYLAGLLTAPKKGSDTRAQLTRKATEQISETEKQLKKAHTQLNDLLAQVNAQTSDASDKVKKELNSVSEKAMAVREKVREVLSNVHEGKLTDDKDLQNAIDAANKAVDSLKKYLTAK